MGADTEEYPLSMGFAYLFAGGYTIRSIFVALGLPPSVGVIFAGYLFTYFSQDDIFAARDELQEHAFFLVLLMAGLEIRISDLRWYIFVIAWFPALCELTGIAFFACSYMNYTLVEGLVLGTTVFALGDGLIIPKMKEFAMLSNLQGHPLPRLVFTHAPLEASLALTIFGVFTGFASPSRAAPSDWRMMVLSNFVRIAATLGCGAALGAATGWFMLRRTDAHLWPGGKAVFNGSSVEAYLWIVGISLFAFSLGQGESGQEFVPMGFCPGSLFQPELLVIVTGCSFAYVTNLMGNEAVLHQIEHIMGGVWVFGQLILFSMLGSKTSPTLLPRLDHVLPVMGIGFGCRALGVIISVFLTARARKSPTDIRTLCLDSIFCLICVLPRATIQGALGAVPLRLGFFSHQAGYVHNQEVVHFMFTAARLYIICTSVLGMLLVNTFGARLLEATLNAHIHEQARYEQLECADGNPRHRCSSDLAAETQHVADLQKVAEHRGISVERLEELLTGAKAEAEAETKHDGVEHRDSHRSSGSYRQLSKSPAGRGEHHRGHKRKEDWYKRGHMRIFEGDAGTHTL